MLEHSTGSATLAKVMLSLEVVSDFIRVGENILYAHWVARLGFIGRHESESCQCQHKRRVFPVLVVCARCGRFAGKRFAEG